MSRETATSREDAWGRIHERLPAGWRVGPPTFDPAMHRFEVAAIGPKLGGRHGGPPASIIGIGADEVEALRDLGERLALTGNSSGTVGADGPG